MMPNSISWLAQSSNMSTEIKNASTNFGEIRRGPIMFANEMSSKSSLLISECMTPVSAAVILPESNWIECAG